MKTIAKVFLILSIAFALFVVTAGAAMTWAIFHSGVVKVRVVDRNWDHDGPHRIYFAIPASFVNMGIRMIPMVAALEEWDHGHHGWSDDDCDDRHWQEQKAIEEWMPVLRVVTEELDRYPDVTFVEVDDGYDHVRVYKRDGALHVDVHSPREEVEIVIPAKTVRLALETLGNLD